MAWKLVGAVVEQLQNVVQKLMGTDWQLMVVVWMMEGEAALQVSSHPLLEIDEVYLMMLGRMQEDED